MELFLMLGLIAVALIFAVFVIPMMFRKVVPTNEVHVLQTAKDTLAYGKGTPKGNVYYKWPTWLPRIGVEVKAMPVSIFNINLEEYEAFDKGKLQFLVDVVAFFRISDYAQAAQKVASIQELHEQLTSIVQGAIRSILAKSDIEEIMEERSKFGDLFTQEVKEQLMAWGVEAVKNIELMDVKDAPKSEIIHNIMAKKKSHIEMESRLEIAKNQKLAEVAEIEARREVELNKQEATQQVGLRTVEAKLKVESAEETKKQQITEQSKVTAERELEVQKIKTLRAAEIEKEAAIVFSNQEKDTAIIRANQLKEQGIIQAEAQLTVKTKQAEADALVQEKIAEAEANATKKRAEAQLDVQLKDAEGYAAKGKATAEAEAALLMAPVTAQIAQAKEIGSNKEYQQYLITVEKVKADQAVGIEQAKALAAANIKVIANTGTTVDAGISSVKELLTSKGGTQLGTMLEGFANTELGKQVLSKAGLDAEQ